MSPIFLILSSLTLCTAQGKRPRLSKETVDSDDDVADFLADSVSTAGPCNDCDPGHPLAVCLNTALETHREPNVTTVSRLLSLQLLLLISFVLFRERLTTTSSPWMLTTVWIYYTILLFAFLTFYFPDMSQGTTKDRTRTVRLLPYVSVPRMDTNSRLFHKAQATLAKQAAASSSAAPFDRQAHMERLFNLHQGA